MGFLAMVVGSDSIPGMLNQWDVILQAFQEHHVDVSENSGTPKSSILIGFSIINHPFWGTPIFGNTHVDEPNFCLTFGQMEIFHRYLSKVPRRCWEWSGKLNGGNKQLPCLDLGPRRGQGKGSLKLLLQIFGGVKTWKHCKYMVHTANLGGGFKYFLFSTLFGEDSHFDY